MQLILRVFTCTSVLVKSNISKMTRSSIFDIHNHNAAILKDIASELKDGKVAIGLEIMDKIPDQLIA